MRVFLMCLLSAYFFLRSIPVVYVLCRFAKVSYIAAALYCTGCTLYSLVRPPGLLFASASCWMLIRKHI